MTAGCGATARPATEATSAAIDDRHDDGDGLEGQRHRCPGEPEDADGWRDDGGCPDLDDDEDRLADADDLCPDEPETYNGIDDEDGCPDRSICRFGSDPIPSPLPDVLAFDPRSSDLTDRSSVILEALVATLMGNPDILELGIVGHADPSERRAQSLALARAEHVRDALMAAGVDGARLDAFTAGASDPIADPTSAEGPARNRRVEFHIMRLTDGPERRWDGVRMVPPDGVTSE